MLVELLIENYAVAEQLRIRFGHGFHALTGETGSGKSIIVDALGLLFGGRASAEMVRAGTDRARISGIFEVPADPELQAKLDDAGIAIEDDELLVEREIQANGKSRAFVGNRPASASLLRELAGFLGDIHGQHDQQKLFSAAEQLELLDDYAHLDAQKQKVADLFREFRQAEQHLADLDRNEQEKLRLLDVWTFQRREIEAVSPEPDEDIQLANESRVLQNTARLTENATAAFEALYDSESSAAANIRAALKRLEDLARIDSSLEELILTLKPAQLAIDEASITLRDYLAKLEADPQRLDSVQSRLAAIERLKRKYGSSIDEILTFLASLKNNIDSVENAAEHRAELERRKAALATQYEKAASALSEARRKAADKMSRSIESELRSLAMPKARFAIDLQHGSWRADGFDNLTFLLSANTGEDLKPLDKIASGGEISRTALAVKSVVSAAQPKAAQGRRTLVFDEVDAGIGGAAAESVGKRLLALAANNQVLCVTHLAQIASYADHHYSVSKLERKGRTVTQVDELHADTRVREIGRMLSGDPLTPEALRHAEQLIQRRAS